jgi:polyphenol oxidase
VPDPALPAPFRWEGEHIAADLPGGRVLFSTRRGGVSEGAYASLNLGRLTSDSGANVDANRARLASAVGLPRERFMYGRQVHGARVRRALEPPGAARPATEEDGQATALRDAAALVFVADCLPVMLVAEPSGDRRAAPAANGSGPDGSAVAALHCGWRGLAGGIVAEGVAAVQELAGPGRVVAALGPGARGCCYEVGEDVHEAFSGVPGARAGERHLDLPAIARHMLAKAGVAEVHDAGLCTICAGAGLFFSHRRDGGITGRQAGVVWRA